MSARMLSQRNLDVWGKTMHRSKRTGLVRALSSILAFVLVFAVISPVFAASEAAPATFADVTAAMLTKYGITQADVVRLSDRKVGRPFRPLVKVTRAEYITFLVKSLTISTKTPLKASFKDVSRKHALYRYVEGALRAGLISRPKSGFFRPGATITREEAASILMFFLAKKYGRDINAVMPKDIVTAQLELFADGDQVSPSLKKSVALAIARGAIPGEMKSGKRYLHPKAQLLRIEALALATKLEKPRVGGVGSAVISCISWVGGELGNQAASGGVNWLYGKIKKGLGIEGEDPLAPVLAQLDLIEGQLTDIQSGIDNLNTELSYLESGLSAQFAKADIDKADSTADYLYQTYMAGPSSYMGTIKNAKSNDATTTISNLDQLYVATNPDGKIYAALDELWKDIHPAAAGARDRSGVLDSFALWACTGALSPNEVDSAFESLEYFFCNLVADQTMGVSLTIQAENAQYSGSPTNPDLGDKNSPDAALYLSGTWRDHLQEECKDYLEAAGYIAATYAKHRSDFKEDMLGDEAIGRQFARAEFVCANFAEQFVIADGGNPQDLYGMHVVTLNPDGVPAAPGSVFAKTTSGESKILEFAYPKQPVSSNSKPWISGPTVFSTKVMETSDGLNTLVCDASKSPVTLGVTESYRIGRLSALIATDSANREFSFTQGNPAAPSWTYPGTTTPKWYDKSMIETTTLDPDARLFGCQTISYQYKEKTADGVYSVPVALSPARQLADATKLGATDWGQTFTYTHGGTVNASHVKQVGKSGWSTGGDKHLYNLNDWSEAACESKSPSFTWVGSGSGRTKADAVLEFWSNVAETKADDSILAQVGFNPSGGSSETYKIALGIEATATPGTAVASVAWSQDKQPLEKIRDAWWEYTVHDTATTPSFALEDGKTYQLTYSASAKQSFAGHGVATCPLNYYSRFSVDHVNVTLK